MLACVALARGEASEAERLAHKALGTAIEHELPPYVFPSLDVLAAVAAALDSFEEAGRILGAADRAREELGRVRWAREQAIVEELQERLCAELGEDAIAEAIAQGAAMSTKQAIAWLRRARGSRKRPAGGWESLTPTERQVVDLAVAGTHQPGDRRAHVHLARHR